jgi:oxygen-dependent protoporphyrinogen oxidase
MTRQLVVVGGGIAGLATAYYAQKHAQAAGLDLAVTLVERDSRLGGKIATDTPDGFVIEGGPDSFITQKPWAIQLCRELGLEDRLMGTNDAQRGVFILRGGKLRKMPDGMMLIIPTKFMPFVTSNLISWPGKIRMGMDLFIPPRKDDSDESLGDFIRRRLGQEALDVLAEPMMAGIHVADAEKLSLKATFPRFIDTVRKYGSLTRGMIAAKKARTEAAKNASNNGNGSTPTTIFMTLKNGLQEMVAALENTILGEGGTIITGNGVQLIRQTGGAYALDLDDGRTLDADSVVLAVPGFAAAEMLSDLNPDLSDKLNAIRYVSTATVSLGFKADEFEHDLNGFGFVIPRKEPTRLLAMTWTSTKFTHRAGEGTVLLRAFIGGPRREEYVSLDDEALIALVREELATIMGVHATPTVARAYRWMRGNPQYDVGHLDRMDEIDTLCPAGLYLTGSAFRGVGIPDCVKQGQATAAQVVAYLGETMPVLN